MMRCFPISPLPELLETEVFVSFGHSVENTAHVQTADGVYI